MIVQEVIYTGRWPTSTGVTSLLGEVLWQRRLKVHEAFPDVPRLGVDIVRGVTTADAW